MTEQEMKDELGAKLLSYMKKEQDCLDEIDGLKGDMKEAKDDLKDIRAKLKDIQKKVFEQIKLGRSITLESFEEKGSE